MIGIVIVTVRGQVCNGIVSAATGCTCSPVADGNTYICSESGFGGDACVEYADLCDACVRACNLGIAAGGLDADTIYGALGCAIGTFKYISTSYNEKLYQFSNTHNNITKRFMSNPNASCCRKSNRTTNTITSL